MPWINALSRNVSFKEAVEWHNKQEARHWGNSPDWINAQPVSEFAKLVEAEAFRTGKRRQEVLDEYHARRQAREMDRAKSAK